MTTYHLSENTPKFALEISEEQAYRLCLEGKIELCPSKHDNQQEGERIYHPTENYAIDASQVEALLVRRSW